MSDGLGKPVGVGLAVGLGFILLFSILSTQVPHVRSKMEFSNEATIDVLPPDVSGEEPVQTAAGDPYAVVKVNKSKVIIISNSGWGALLRHTKTAMTIEKITIYPNDNKLQERMPDMFEWKDSNFFVLIMNYTMENVDGHEYYPIVHASAIEQDGKRYEQDVFPGEMGMLLYPGERRSSWFGLQIPQDADEVTLEVRDGQTNRKLWTLELDMQPYGQKPSNQEKFRQLPDDFALVYSYGYGHDITLDTKKDMVIQVTCDEPPLYNVSLSLSKEQLTTIWHTVLENNFFDIPDFTEDCPNPLSYCISMSPESSARLKVTAYNQTHIVDFRQGYELNLSGFDSDFAKYKEITAMLEEIISTVELSQSSCAYL